MSTLNPLASNYPLRPLKYFAPLRGQKVDALPEGGEYLGLEQFESWTGKLSGVELQQPPVGGANVFEPGDVLFGKLRPYLAKGWVADRTGYCSTESLVLSPPSADPRFVRYCLLTHEVVSAIDGSTYGSKMPRADWAFIGAVKLPHPSKAEQKSIANFLDAQTTRIDALIAEKEALSERLAEYRQSVISHAVTKGLDPSTSRKDTNIEWLGKIPSHWDMKKLKHVGTAIIGLTYDPTDIVEEGQGILVLRSSNVQGGKIVFDDNVYVSTSIPSKLLTKPGDILICSRNGSRALIGKNAMIDDRAADITWGAFMTVFRSGDNDYLRWPLNSHLFEFQSASFLTSTINQLTIHNLYGFEIPFPPRRERLAISAYLDEKTKQIDSIRDHVVEHISRLREYRSSLISAAVTGQIDISSYKLEAA